MKFTKPKFIRDRDVRFIFLINRTIKKTWVYEGMMGFWLDEDDFPNLWNYDRESEQWDLVDYGGKWERFEKEKDPIWAPSTTIDLPEPSFSIHPLVNSEGNCLKVWVDDLFFCPNTLRYWSDWEDTCLVSANPATPEEFWEFIGNRVKNCNRVEIKASPSKGFNFRKIGLEMLKFENREKIEAAKEEERKKKEAIREAKKAAAPDTVKTKTVSISNARGRKGNFVYIMKNKRNGFYKIGKSLTPKVREKTLQAEEPEIEMVFSAEWPDSKERELHARYAEKRLRGEWFELSKFDVAKIVKELKAA